MRNTGKTDRLWVEVNLSSSIEYHSWIADPNFFLLSYNPSGTPSIWENVKVKIKQLHMQQSNNYQDF